MRRLIALLLVVGLVLTLTAPAAHAHHHQAIGQAIGAAFALPFILPFAILSHLAAPFVVYPPQPVYAYPTAVTVQRPVVIARPAYAYAPPAYASPTNAGSPPPPYASHAAGVYAAAPPPPVQPSVVQYAHGRYELRGDGVNTAYQWVWFPNAPPPAPR
jgi:hypothetical protein